MSESARKHESVAGATADHRLTAEPWYLPVGDEVEVFVAAYEERLPVLLKGPTGCGKTRFVEHVTWHLYRGQDAAEPRGRLETPLVTVACHEDLTGTDLVGRYLLAGDETVWMDGPLTRAVREGAICYLDEIVETRIVAHESGVDEASAERLSVIGERVRNLREHGFEEGVSTRLLIYAAKLITRGIEPRRACDLAIAHSVTDDEELVQAINEIVDVLLP